MNQQPLVSIIIPTYNREKCIKKAIDSALNQSYKNIEIIIIDGSPNNKTEEVISPYLVDSRIHYIHQPEIHTGSVKDRANIAKARNKALRISKGKYIATLDDDDFWYDKKKLEKQVQFLENHSDYVLCGGGLIVINEKNPENPLIFKLYPEKDEDIRKGILIRDTFITSALVFRKDVAEAIGGYDEEHPLCEDFDFILKLGKMGKLYNFQEYFACFPGGQQKWEGRIKFGRANLKDNIRVIKNYGNDYPGYSEAIILAWLRYFYSFLPFGERMRPIAAKIKYLVHFLAKFRKK